MASTRTLFAAGLALIAVITLSAVVVVQQFVRYVSRPITATIYYQVSGSNTDIQDIQWTIPASQGQPFSQSVPYTHSEHLPAPGPDHSVEFTLQGTAGVYCLNLSWVPDV